MWSSRSRLAVGAAGIAAVVVVATMVSLSGKPRPEDGVMAGSVAANGFTLTSTVARLPVDDVALPTGPNVDQVRATCTACHSAAMLTGQPPLTATQWRAIVAKMRKVYRAEIPAKDEPAIVAYLVGMPRH